MLSQDMFKDREFFSATLIDMRVVRVVEVEVMFLQAGFEVELEAVRLYVFGITSQNSCKSLERRREGLLEIAHGLGSSYSLTRSVAFCVTIGVVPGRM